MKRGIKSVLAFFDKHGWIYDNPHGVQIIINPDQSVIVGCGWPRNNPEIGTDLDLTYESNSFIEFLDHFHITQKRQIDKITPSMLIALYYQGLAGVTCAIDLEDDYLPLTFYRQNLVVIASTDSGEMHEVLKLPRTPRQFIDYTKQYFQLV